MTLKMMSYGKNRLFAVAMMTTLFTLTLILTLTQTFTLSAFAQFDCSAVTEIPTSECDALFAIRRIGDEDNWNDNWLELSLIHIPSPRD